MDNLSWWLVGAGIVVLIVGYGWRYLPWGVVRLARQDRQSADIAAMRAGWIHTSRWYQSIGLTEEQALATTHEQLRNLIMLHDLQWPTNES